MPLGLFVTTKANLLAGKYTFSYLLQCLTATLAPNTSENIKTHPPRGEQPHMEPLAAASVGALSPHSNKPIVPGLRPHSSPTHQHWKRTAQHYQHPHPGGYQPPPLQSVSGSDAGLPPSRHTSSPLSTTTRMAARSATQSPSEDSGHTGQSAITIGRSHPPHLRPVS